MQKQVSFLEATISYTDLGTGDVVVLVHGFAEDSSVWHYQISALQQHCRLIIPDLPGSGQSTLLQKPDAGMEDYARVLHHLLAAEGIDNCIMLGHSMGGYITHAFAELFPQKLRALGFVHSTAFADSEEKKNTRRKGIRMIEEYGAYAFIKLTTPNLFSDSYKAQHEDKVEELIEKGKHFASVALVQYYKAMIDRPARVHVLQQTNLPVLFIAGSEDVAVPLNDFLEQAHLPKIAFIHLLEGVGHMGMWEKPGQVNEWIGAFVGKVKVLETERR